MSLRILFAHRDIYPSGLWAVGDSGKVIPLPNAKCVDSAFLDLAKELQVEPRDLEMLFGEAQLLPMKCVGYKLLTGSKDQFLLYRPPVLAAYDDPKYVKLALPKRKKEEE